MWKDIFQSKVVLKMRLNPNIAVLLFVVSRFDFVFFIPWNEEKNEP